tara:strand:+ start:102 stop:230 length:129 start_codon:yes stop_codon:yes gene_type:complete
VNAPNTQPVDRNKDNRFFKNIPYQAAKKTGYKNYLIAFENYY